MAILLGEPEAAPFADQLTRAGRVAISAGSYLEVAIVADGKGTPDAARLLAALVAEVPIEIVPVSVEQAEYARVAYKRFGKGNHPARLNFGDCFAYALAKERGEPLLFKGTDFALTDIELALSL